MEFGVVLPHIGAFAREQVVERIQAVAQHADTLGFHSVWVGDHVVFPAQLESKYPYHPEGKFPVDTNDNFLDPLTVLAYVAACTKTVRLATGVLIVPYRNPIVTAKMVATIDVLSHGRVILGGGSGWLKEEFEVLHAPYHERGNQTDEYLQVMKALWTQDEAQFDGRYEKFSGIKCEPKPVQKPHPPIWIGGHSKRALRRTATLGDGWYGTSGSTAPFWRDPDGFAKDIVSIKELAEQGGRDPDSLTYAALLYERTFENVLRALPRYEQAGLNHVVLAFFAWTDQFEEVLTLMERFAKEVGLQDG